MALPAKLAYSQIGSCACQNYTIKHGRLQTHDFSFLVCRPESNDDRIAPVLEFPAEQQKLTASSFWLLIQDNLRQKAPVY